MDDFKISMLREPEQKVVHTVSFHLSKILGNATIFHLFNTK